ncbi:hypothetical protein EJV47_23215 [Hymenobacter gummosus]|uniref:Uncharacterized protein n=1 Tax=Hymenobacter gummosus TaxID=1776032 RepID=A0A431TWS0_9BACT|nr:hypothetical protein [Hymenobacter gummosus]RTQ46066.1 hypothetical protein EJV47_23215 [Hymenobacter gummosus]
MPKLPMLLPECYVDTALARALAGDQWKNLVNKKNGAPNVALAMQAEARSHGNSRCLVGVVDDDKKLDDIAYLREFTQQVAAHELGRRTGFRIRQHRSYSAHYLVVLAPACDGWLHAVAASAGLVLPEFGLPVALPAFLDFTKQKGVENTPELKRLLRAIGTARPAAYQELADFVAEVMGLTPRYQ